MCQISKPPSISIKPQSPHNHHQNHHHRLDPQYNHHRAMANLTVLSLSLTVLLLFNGCLAFRPFQQHQNECRIQRINALEPNERVTAEAGSTEFFDANDQQFQCAGVEVIRHRIQPRGLLLPTYINTPLMVYILQGN